MTGWIVQPEAAADLDAIWDYTFQNWGIEQAEAYLLALDRTFARIAAGHAKGKAMPGKHLALLQYRVGSHFIVYRPSTDEIKIARILHVRMDPDLHLS